ncbi:MAG: PAS domain S-box protein [Deltaproteobacteria bacterium]|nr:PAS domain S-box protein [Deltaproteobacteria bacterium]
MPPTIDLIDQYKYFFQSSVDGFLVLDENGVIQDANPKACSIFEQPFAFFLQTSIQDVSHEDFKDHLKKIDTCLKSKKDLETEEIKVNINNETSFFELKGGWLKLQQNDQFLITLRDITKAELVEREFKKIYTAVIQSPVSVVITDTKGKIEYVNPKFSELTGYSLEEAMGKNPRILKSGKQDSTIYQQLWDTITQKQVWKGEFHNLKKNGESYWESASVSAIVDEKGEVTHYLAVKEDITKQKELEDALRENMEKLSDFNLNLESKIQEEIERNKAKDLLIAQQTRYAQMGEILNMIAHQWKQPLNAISATATEISLLSGFKDLPVEVIQDRMKFIEKQTQYMSDIIHDFMDFFRPDKEKQEFRFKETFENVKNIGSYFLKQQNTTLSFDFDENLSLRGFKKELEQVLINLISNSCAAFETKRGLDSHIRIKAEEKSDAIILSVIDNAGGIPKKIIGKIFEPYYTTKPKDKGTGIGLYMSKQIIEKSFGGKIEVESEGETTRFDITLPK